MLFSALVNLSKKHFELLKKHKYLSLYYTTILFKPISLINYECDTLLTFTKQITLKN